MTKHSPKESASILFVSLGPQPNVSLQMALNTQRFPVWVCESQMDLAQLIEERDWPLMVLDLHAAGTHTLDRCTAVRGLFQGPLAVTLPSGLEASHLDVFETGADEVFSWPMDPGLLAARLRVLTRRFSQPNTYGAGALPPCKIGELCIDTARREVSRAGKIIRMTSSEFDLLHLLAGKVGSVVTREEINHHLRGLPHNEADRSIDLRISRLRRKLGDNSHDPVLIRTVWGAGYLLTVPSLDT